MSNTYSQRDLAQLDNELARLQEIESYEILDTLPEQEYDDIALLSAQICNTPMSTVAIVDESRKWHKAKYGLDKEYVPRDFAICSHTICDDKMLIVEDTHKHDVFKHIGIVNNPPYVRFYAGVPLINEAGHALGTLCVIDTKPNSLTQYQQQALQALARQTMALLELRKALAISQHLEKRVTEQNRQLKALSQTDELTNLFNRRVLDRELSRELKRSKRYGGEFSLLMMDVDNFKQLNDSQGHATGDLALIAIANLLKQESRDTDFCIRFGGDEFMLLMSNTNAKQAQDIACRIRQRVAQHQGVLVDLTLSIGVAHIEQFDLSECDILKLADQGLYRAKRQGRNQTVLMTPTFVDL
ncbi:sensor domain-containing diguanylate cyclase [Psychrobium sp. MM17-31]|uniref:sensor domain-containing diguanylate cyclase n=1 Tax=Psychrobium sp. MM17-31 TaxID=2917758 RepID=UPI001EF6A049|nr:sensor domain-containing diguanylate cyclase [Psychrobium sp. MM17-31]MCG7530014.1 sensor domain-containing diguanylate cyclase [Psychrobium sp. MM17-31]